MKRELKIMIPVFLIILICGGCTKKSEDFKELRTSNSLEVRQKLKSGDLISDDVMRMFTFHEKNSLKKNNDLKKIKYSRDFKVDVDNLLSELIIRNQFNPALKMGKISMYSEDLKWFKDEIEQSNVSDELLELKRLRDDIDEGEEKGSLNNDDYLEDFYKNREKSFVQLNNKLITFSEKNNDTLDPLIVSVVVRNYSAYLLGKKMQLFLKENGSNSKRDVDTHVKGMKDIEKDRLVQNYTKLKELSGVMEAKVF